MLVVAELEVKEFREENNQGTLNQRRLVNRQVVSNTLFLE
jgi:hypothetical protein